MAPTVLVEEWFGIIAAPRKEFFVIENGGHLTIFTMHDIFLEKLIAIPSSVISRTAADPT